MRERNKQLDEISDSPATFPKQMGADKGQVGQFDAGLAGDREDVPGARSQAESFADTLAEEKETASEEARRAIKKARASTSTLGYAVPTKNADELRQEAEDLKNYAAHLSEITKGKVLDDRGYRNQYRPPEPRKSRR